MTRRAFCAAALALTVVACDGTTSTNHQQLKDDAGSGGGSSSGNGGSSSSNGGARSTVGGSNGGGSVGAPADGGDTGGAANGGGAGGTTASGGSPSALDAGVSGAGGAPGEDGGPNGTPKKDSVVISGTRLKGKYVTGPDGARIYRRGVLFDSQLGVDCTYRKAADGSLRCIPQNGYASPPAVLFKDPACLTGGAVWLPGVPSGCSLVPPAYVIDLDSVAYCAAPLSDKELSARVYPVGALLGTVSGTYYRRDATTAACVTVNGSVNGIPYALGAEVVPATFVVGTQRLAP